MIDVQGVARALCGEDGQRHLSLGNRDGKPCSMHERAADAVWPVIEEALYEEYWDGYRAGCVASGD